MYSIAIRSFYRLYSIAGCYWIRAVNSMIKAQLVPVCPCVFLTAHPVVISGFLCPRAGFLWGYLGLLPFLIPPSPAQQRVPAWWVGFLGIPCPSVPSSATH